MREIFFFPADECGQRNLRPLHGFRGYHRTPSENTKRVVRTDASSTITLLGGGQVSTYLSTSERRKPIQRAHINLIPSHWIERVD
ncbi:hypothetical protein SK128_004677 [Halocaridina rubra]|uniref:Uncharacterized protein n=1 Tax=Halocaridina rubra TaxID=373956 RepID=A0AAN8XJM3_HALRR